MILEGGKRKFLKRQRESGIKDRIWAIVALSLHNAYYAVFFLSRPRTQIQRN